VIILSAKQDWSGPMAWAWGTVPNYCTRSDQKDSEDAASQGLQDFIFELSTRQGASAGLFGDLAPRTSLRRDDIRYTIGLAIQQFTEPVR
jgi:hypothetical protein